MEESESGSLASSSTMANPSTTSSSFVPRTTPDAQHSIRSVLKRKEKVQANKLVGSCFLWSNVPFSIAKNNPFYQLMFDVVAIIGLG